MHLQQHTPKTPVSDLREMLMHATSVSIDGAGVLLLGPSGTGKSDLALRLIDQGSQLIADDQTHVRLEDGQLIASVPAAIAGLLEVRQVGLLQMPHAGPTPVRLAVDLQNAVTDRMPERNMTTLLGVEIPLIHLPAFAFSTPAKVRAALRYPLADR